MCFSMDANPTPAPSQQARCLVRSHRLRHLLLAVNVTLVLEHMGGRVRALRGRGHKDKQYSVSSQRSSSLNSRRSSVASMTPSINGLAALRERQSESIISASGLVGGVPLARSRSDAPRRNFGAQTPISEGEYEGSGLGHRAAPGRAASNRLVHLRLGGEEESATQRAAHASFGGA